MELSLRQIADLVGGTVSLDPEFTVSGAGPFDEAGPDRITFAGGRKFLERLSETRAGAVIVPRGVSEEGRRLVLVDNPSLAFARVMARFHAPKVLSGIHPTAVIGRGFSSGEGFYAGPGVVVGEGVTVGDRVALHANAVLGDGVTLGDDVVVRENVSLLWGTVVGSRVLVHAGTVIGGDGFGFAQDGERHEKIPQVGKVSIGDDVEIGALNAIDRASFGETRIGSGVKTDNLVHIGHNVSVGDNSILVAQVGVSGSTKIGRNAVLLGQAGINGHIEIGDYALVGPKAGVAQSVPAGQMVSGIPAIPHRLWLRAMRVVRMLPQLNRELADLRKRLVRLEEKGHGDGS